MDAYQQVLKSNDPQSRRMLQNKAIHEAARERGAIWTLDAP